MVESSLLIRASSVPLIFKCKSFIHCPAVISPSSRYSEEGTRKHQEIRDCILSGKTSSVYPELDKYLRFADRQAQEDCFIDVEKRLEKGILHGTPDLVVKNQSQSLLMIIDLKTGYRFVSVDSEQLLAYAYLALNDKTEKIIVAIFQQGEFRLKTYSPTDVLNFYEDLCKYYFCRKQEYTPGDHCAYCNSICPDQLEGFNKIMGMPISPATIARYGKKMIRHLDKQYNSLLQNKIAPVGYEFFDLPTSGRRYVDLSFSNENIRNLKLRTVSDFNEALEKDQITQQEYDDCVFSRKSTYKRILMEKEKQNGDSKTCD